VANAPVLSGRVRILPPCAALGGITPALRGGVMTMLSFLALATPARAYEDQLTAGAGAGYAHAASSGFPRHGVIFDLSASAGLGPVWSVRARASYGLHPGDRPLHAMLLGADLLYLVDVVEVVPYFGAGASGIARAYRDDLQLDAAAQLVIGFGYLISRELTFELEARPYLIATELDGDPFYGAVSASVVFMFDS
jgi:hypothetical protein